jgi:hypothetical protein
MRLIIIIVLILFSCDKRSSDCVFAASSPTNVILKNNCNSDREVSFYAYDSSKKEFNLIKITTVYKDALKTICIDNEGSVAEGLYIKMTDRTKMIKLGMATGFKLNLCDDSFQIEKSNGPR